MVGAYEQDLPVIQPDPSGAGNRPFFEIFSKYLLILNGQPLYVVEEQQRYGTLLPSLKIILESVLFRRIDPLS